MIIAVNCRLVVKDKFCGISWFAYEALKRMTRNHPEHRFLFFFDRPYSEEFIFGKNVTPVVAGPPTRHPFLWHWWFQVTIPKLLRKYKPDVFLSPDGFLPLNTDVKTINVIHDIGFEHYNENLPFLPRAYYRRYFPKYAQRAQRLATVSQFSKHDIAKTYNIDPQKIDVVFDGASDAFRPLNDTQKAAVRGTLTNGADYFVAVGRLHLRKNTERLLQAYDQFRRSNATAVKLVIVGNRKWQSPEVKAVYNRMQFRNDVVFTGRVPVKRLGEIIGAAVALVHIPHIEGFGMAAIEAMQCDVPVITNRQSSMPEVAGDAALYVDALSVDSITEGIQRVYTDATLRAQLISNGRIQRSLYSWEKTAEKLWDCIAKVAGQAAPETVLEKVA